MTKIVISVALVINDIMHNTYQPFQSLVVSLNKRAHKYLKAFSSHKKVSILYGMEVTGYPTMEVLSNQNSTVFKSIGC